MIELKFKHPTAILPARGDKLVLKLSNDQGEVTGHVECDRITVFCNNKITAENYTSKKNKIDIRTIAYPNNGEFGIVSPEGEYVHILVHKTNGTEWITEEIVSAEDASTKVHITNLKGKTTDVPTIKGFDGNINFPSIMGNYRAQIGYLSSGVTRVAIKYGSFPGKIRTIGVSMIDYNRLKDTEIKEFGVCEINADKNDKMIIEALGYECEMTTAFPINANGSTSIIHEVKWVMINY